MAETTENIVNKHEPMEIETETEEAMKRAMKEAKKDFAIDMDTPKNPTIDEKMIKDGKMEKHDFDAQVDSLLSILINSVYTSKEYFLRELVSNASDAIDKRRKIAQMESEVIMDELCIKISADKEKKTITITDTGIGMSKADLVSFLGSIAKSGTKEFKKKLAEKKDSADMGALIGQFGLGFYSAFLVADHVDVISKKKEDIAYIWSSKGPGGFVIAPYNGEMHQGTSVVLHISEKCEEYLEEKKLESILKTHSGFVEYPIYLWVMTEKTRKIPKKAAEKTETDKPEDTPADRPEEEEIEEIKEEKAVEEEEEKYVEGEYKHLNSQAPLWSRNPETSKIEESEYESFYKTLTNDWEKYFAVNHSFIEGDVEFQVLLFVQNRPVFSVFEAEKTRNIKLYVQNVLVSCDMTEVVPEWLSFVHGVISSKDIPINVSREIVQGKSTMNLIKKVLLKKVIDMIKDIQADGTRYAEFYKNFGQNIKLGIYRSMDSGLSKKLAPFLRFETSKSDGKLISLDEYIGRMQPEQKHIYIISGISMKEIKENPILQKMKDLEVVYMDQPIDEFVVSTLNKYKDFEFQRITSDEFEMPGEKKDIKEEEESHKEFTAKIKEVLGDPVEKVTIFSDADDKTTCLVKSSKHAYSGTMERIMMAQPSGGNVHPMMATGYLTRKVFQINVQHPTIKGLKRKFDEKEDKEFERGVKLIYEASLLACGYPTNSTSLPSIIFDYMQSSLSS